MEDSTQPQAFVLLPFEEEFEEIYKRIQNALAHAGYEARRADSDLAQENIMRTIIEGIRHADLIVADLTTVDPNVMYELGVAHAREKPTIMLTQSIEDLPFDLDAYRVIQYSTDFRQIESLDQQIVRVTTGIREGRIPFGNPVMDFWPVEISELQKQNDEPEEETSAGAPHAEAPASAEEDDLGDSGFIDWAVDAETALVEITKSFDNVVTATQRIGQGFENRTEELNKVDRTQPGSAKRVQIIALKAAHGLDEYKKELKGALAEIRPGRDKLEYSVAQLMGHTQTVSDEDTQQIQEFKTTASATATAISEACEGLQMLREAVDRFEGMSRSMNVARRGLLPVIDELDGELDGFKAFFNRVIDEINEKVNSK